MVYTNEDCDTILARKCNLESYYHITQVYIISNANLYSHIYYKLLLSSKQKYQLSASAVYNL